MRRVSFLLCACALLWPLGGCDEGGDGVIREPGEDVDTRLFWFRHVPTDEAPLALDAWQRVTVEARTLEDDTVGSFNVPLASVEVDDNSVVEVTGIANGQFILRGLSEGQTSLTIVTAAGLTERLDVETSAVYAVEDATGRAPTEIHIQVGDVWVRSLRLVDVWGTVLAGNWTWQAESEDTDIATVRGFRDDTATNMVEITGLSVGTTNVRIGPGHDVRVEVEP